MMKLGSMAVVVSDAQKAESWYHEALGLEKRQGGDHWVTLTTPDANVELHLCADFFPLEPGNSGIAFLTDDLRAAYEDLKSRGVEFTTPPKDEEWGSYAMFSDPDGNEFWLIEE